MKSYIVGRHQVLIDGFVLALGKDSIGSTVRLCTGADLFTKALFELVLALGINCHFFSDNSQLYNPTASPLLGVSQD
jgi:hypothetical protein